MPGKYTSKLDGQRVLVIGGTSGIGLGLAEALLEHGASVVVSSSSADRVASAVASLQKEIPAAAGRISGHACDLGSAARAEANVAGLFAAACGGADYAHKLDHVVYTAGDALAVRRLAEWDLAGMQQAGMVRFFGPALVAQHLQRALRAPDSPACSFTLTSGTIADRPAPDWAVIGGFGAGVLGLMRGLALDLAPVRVNAVALGAVDTNLWAAQRADGTFAQFADMVRGMSTTGELGRVEDVVEAFLYVLKDRNCTGACIQSNSGVLLK